MGYIYTRPSSIHAKAQHTKPTTLRPALLLQGPFFTITHTPRHHTLKMPRSCSDQCTSIDESNARAAGDISPSHSAESVDGPYCPYAYSPKTYYSYSDEDSGYKHLMEGSPPAKPKDSDEEDNDEEDANEDEYPFLSSGDVVFKKCALDLPFIGKNKKKREEEEEEAGSAKNKKKQKKTRAGRGHKKDKAKKKKAKAEGGRAMKKMF